MKKNIDFFYHPWFFQDYPTLENITLGLASVSHSSVIWVPSGAPISWLGMYIIGATVHKCADYTKICLLLLLKMSLKEIEMK